jgi:electron transfer flavoprotein alpha subunit
VGRERGGDTLASMIAVVPVRGGELPAGGEEAVAEARGRVLLVGERARGAVDALEGIAADVRTWDTPGFAPAAWAGALAPLLAEERIVVLPASPDGRDLAPRIAALLDHSSIAGAIEVREDRVTTVGFGGAVMEEHPLRGSAVVTLQPGVRGVHRDPSLAMEVERLDLELPAASDAEVLEVLPPDVTTMDLSEAPRILGGGNGLESADRFDQLTRIATALDASVGTTRVITDKGWLPHERQIGTTGVVVAPKLYLAFGISGAVQHTAGLGDPSHVVSVNTEGRCPMMGLADLAIVADANATLDALEARLAGCGETTA